ncbi:hypothetical protein K505DRAFT_376270 [Melanomma pulvis-pyrius CBS 109.77]|uniref:Uncharacterized protein n=1 Tax=Melanomma pulvis-pyrius CBS 109.77 TaxID=1314802 RepID=A0A6A6X8C4_9PLEO|nr:hypothetical protein K505DRAFT_376270 [Melanomma pulvis-pyrius CBS 109.77]
MESQDVEPKVTKEIIQPLCRFLVLPRELHDELYPIVFTSTHLSWGVQPKSHDEKVSVKPAANSLALLRTYRQINLETRDFWLPRVLFDFLRVDVMLDKLSPLPSHIICQVRHMRVFDPLHRLADDVLNPSRIRMCIC